MKDIELARKIMEDEQQSLVIVKDGKIIIKSDMFGIKPLYLAVKEKKELLKEASVADKVIGKGAAMLYGYAEVKEIHTNLISDKAIESLKKTNIKLEYNESCEYIINRTNTGMCPVEKLSSETEDIDELMQGINDFLKRINLL